MSGFDIGTLEIHSLRVHSLRETIQSASIAVIAGPGSSSTTSDTSISSSGELVFPLEEPICLPIVKRHQIPTRFDLRSSGSLIQKQGTIAEAILWLRKLVDGEMEKVELPLWSEQWKR
jgi:hypothetical protein